MKHVMRESAVRFDCVPQVVEARENWSVVLQYENEGPGPWLVDLAHKNRFDLQNRNIEELDVDGIPIPSAPGNSILEKSTLINRMNATQASVIFLGKNNSLLKDGGSCTDVTEATVFLALFGPHTFEVAEKLTALDFLAPGTSVPFLYQGPFCHVPCQIVTVVRDQNGSGGILISCSRGYAESMVEAILDSGAEFGLRPAGEDRFTAWMQSIEGAL